MTTIDTVLLILLGGFILAGFWFGIVHMIGSLLGVVIGTALAGRWYAGLAAWLHGFLDINENLLKIVAFMLIFSLTVRIVGLLINLVDKVISIVSFIPFLKLFDRLLGALFGLLEGTLALGIAVNMAARFPLSAEFAQMLRESTVAMGLNLVGFILLPLLPHALRAVRSVLQ